MDNGVAAKAAQQTFAGKVLAGHSAVVTGSSSGIGLGIARRLAGAGADVMLNGIEARADKAALVDEIAKESGSNVAYAQADLSKAEGVEGLIAEARTKFGKVDILVNNAGIQHVSPVEDFPAAKWEFIIALNLSAAFYGTRAVFADMKKAGYGRIINVASAHGLVASPFKSAYVAAKHGVVGFTKTIALEGAEFGVTANAICPGYVLTPLVEAQIGDQAKAHGIPEEEVVRNVLLAGQPTKQFVKVEELAELAVLLCSPAGASITGTAIPVDGGWTAH